MKTHGIQKRGAKATSLNIRIDPRQKSFWEDSIKDLGVDDLSSYIRNAVDRCIAQDLRAHDPKWQAFVQAMQEPAMKILGQKLVDDVDARTKGLKAHKLGV